MKHSGDLEDWRNSDFGLYIHWPFCQSKCPYCDFNSHVAAKVDQQRWLKAYLAEIKRVADQTPNRVLHSIFFGGGTPSLMDPTVVDAIIGQVRQSWNVANDVEITLEANPSSVEAGRFRAYQQAGVNRASIGVQALNDPDLKALGRLHSAREAKKAIEVAQETFERFSFDLIYARQGQSLDAWRVELDEAMKMAEGHISLYQLTIEDGTAFGDRFRRGRLKGLPSEDLGADMYIETQRLTSAAGFSSYEVSNYAKPGQQSRHNCIYWNAGDYIGIGPGAHGRLTIDGTRFATEAILHPTKWLMNIEAGLNVENLSEISAAEQGVEYLMMGLRHEDGISLKRFSRLSGSNLDGSAISELVNIGMIAAPNDRLTVTQSGRLVLNSVIEKLMR